MPAFPLAPDVAAAVVPVHVLRVHLRHALLVAVAGVAVRLLAFVVFAFAVLLVHIGGYELRSFAEPPPVCSRYVYLVVALPVPPAVGLP